MKCGLQVKCLTGWLWVAKPSLQKAGATTTTTDKTDVASALDKPWFERQDVANHFRMAPIK